jgi:predicted PurR-regulated permease PerM
VNRTFVLKAEKWAIWIAVIGVLFLLRHLFAVFFLTFVLSYIGNTAVNALMRRFPNRKVCVAIVFAVLLAILATVLFLVVPRTIAEARNLARAYITTEAIREETPGPHPEGGMLQRQAHDIVDDFIVTLAGRDTFDAFRRSDAYDVIVTRVDTALAVFSAKAGKGTTLFINAALMFAFHFFIAAILSFLMLWDLPKTKERMQRFAHGRTADIYAEIAPGARSFGLMLGRAFEAQTVVAIVNAVLSSVVFLALGLPSIALLATSVFLCSYIPILGMFISTAPAAILAFKVGGAMHVVWLVIAILVIHAIEAYMLNPLIYGRHLRLHPLAVLIVLLVAEHLFGVWGLLLGVPMAAFVLKYVIEGDDVTVKRERPDDPVDVAPV